MRILAAVAVLAAMLTPAAARPMMCPMIYKPVCAMTRFHRPITFGNACLARADHARILYAGRCRHR